MDLHEVSARAVMLDDRLRLPVERIEPALDRLGRVVGTPFDLAALEQALARNGVVDLEQEHDRERPADVLEHLVERLRLSERARVAVEHEAVAGALDLLADERDGDLVRHELSRRQERLDLLSELAAGRDRRAVEIAAGDVRDAVLGRDPLRLRPLARPLRAEDEHVHAYLNKPS